MGRLIGWVMGAAFAVTLAGCFDYEETLTLKADGSGEVVLKYAFPIETWEMMGQYGPGMGGDQGDDEEDDDEDGDRHSRAPSGKEKGEKKEHKKADSPFAGELRVMLASDGVTVKDIQESDEKLDKGDRHVMRIVLAFDSIPHLLKNKVFEQRRFSIKKETSGDYTISSILKTDMSALGGSPFGPGGGNPFGPGPTPGDDEKGHKGHGKKVEKKKAPSGDDDDDWGDDDSPGSKMMKDDGDKKDAPKGGSNKDSDEEEDEGDEEDGGDEGSDPFGGMQKKMMEAAKNTRLTFRIVFPGDVVETNAHTKDGRTCTWSFGPEGHMDELAGGFEMKAVIKGEGLSLPTIEAEKEKPTKLEGDDDAAEDHPHHRHGHDGKEPRKGEKDGDGEY